MRYGKADGPQAEIVAALRKAGAFVQVLSGCGGGVPDLLVAARGQWLLLEVKTATGKLTPAQLIWHAQCRASIHIVRSISEALSAVFPYTSVS